MTTNEPDLPKADDPAVELERVRSQVVAQARELAVIRWELSSLMRQLPVTARVAKAKSSILRRFPKQAQKVLGVRRVARRLITKLRTKPSAVPHTGGVVDVGLSQSFRGPMLLIGDSPFVQQLAGATAAQDFVQVEQGAGFTRSLPVPQANEPPLRTPAEGSFVKWLIDNASHLRKFGTIVVDAADDLSLGLLRGRLDQTQTLVLTATTDASIISPFVGELGEPSANNGSASSYSNFPMAWLDPLDQDSRGFPSIVERMSWPKISVVMVSFNQADFLEEGLRSVLEQGYPNLEFIVIDGNSTDGSVDILNRYRDRLGTLVIERDRGQSDGLNKGFARATGDIVTWVNSDDLLEPGALFRVAQAFATPGVDMVAGGCRQIGLSRDKIILNHHNRLPFGIPVALPLGLLLEMDRFWLTGSFFYQPEVFFSRDIWRRSGGRLRTDLNYVLDYDLWVRMAAAGAHIIHIPEFLACSRTHDQQKTTVGMPYLPEVQRLLQEYSSRLVS
ncbi:MAG: hypothetical protein QOD56_1157, partial [Gammaproteobacteria bacterium]|nr:hypothetical protein [Gammaproteobacteria bacterium]